MKLPRLTPNHLIVMSTILILGLGYFLYLKVYISSKEDKMIATRFRVLDQIGLNIKDKIDGNKSNIDAIIKKFYEKYSEERNSGKLDHAKNTADSLNHFLNHFINDYLKNSGEQYNKNLEILKVIPDSLLKYPDKFYSEVQYDPGYEYFAININPDSIKAAIIFDVVIRISYKSLLDGLLRPDAFSEFIIVKDSLISYNTLSGDLLIHFGQADKENEDGVKQKKGIFSFFNHAELKNELLIAGRSYDVNISNSAYKLFFQPIQIQDRTVYLGGLVRTSDFNKERHSATPRLMLILSFSLFLIILSLPLIKLKMISPNEQLGTGAIIISALSVLICGTLTVLFFYFIQHNISRVNKNDRRIAELANQINREFNEELSLIFNQLKYYDDNYAAIKKQRVSSAMKTSREMSWDILDKNKLVKDFPESYPYFEYVFWLDKQGMQKYQLTTFDKPAVLMNLKDRDYFRNAGEWFFQKSETDRFRIESIVSLRSGSIKGAFSMPSRTLYPVIAMTSRFYSVIDPVVPENYHFCIIDETGKVWFHSEKERNLRENFIKECDDSKNITAAIYASIAKPLNITYFNKSQRAYIRPIDGLPLYLITYYNRSAEHSFQSQVFSLTSVQIILLIGFLFIQTIVLLIIDRLVHKKGFRNIVFQLSRPMKNHNKEYIFLSWLYIFLAILFAVTASWMNGMQGILAALMLITIVYPYSYCRLNRGASEAFNKMWFILFNAFLLLCLNISGLIVLKHTDYFHLLIFQALIISVIIGAPAIIGYTTDRFLHGLTDRCNKFLSGRFLQTKLKKGKSYLINYVIFLQCLLILFGIVPSLKFIESSYDTESEIRMKHSLLNLAKIRDIRNNEIKKYYKSLTTAVTIDKVIASRLEKGCYYNFLDNYALARPGQEEFIESSEEPERLNLWDTLVCYIRPPYDEFIKENKYLVFPPADTSRMKWYVKDGRVALTYRSSSEGTYASASRIQVSGEIYNARFLFPARDEKVALQISFNLIFWIIIAFLMYILYRICKFGVTRLYGMDIVESYPKNSFCSDIRNQREVYKRAILVRLSATDETKCLIYDLIDEEGFHILDWLREDNIAPAAETGADMHATSVIDNFDADYQNPDLFRKKIDLLMKEFHQKEIPVILVMQSHPNEIIEYYQKKIGIAEKNVKEIEAWKISIPEWQNLVHDFQQLVSSSIIRFMPVNYCFRSHAKNKNECEPEQKYNIEQFITYELSACDYLLQFHDAVMVYYKKLDDSLSDHRKEEYILHYINQLAGKYYTEILASCSEEEKYILSDIAEDQIINPTNTRAIFSLLDKGLLVRACDTIKIMNDSFHRFIIRSLPKYAIPGIQGNISRETGTWKGYKITLILVIAALFVFIILTNQDFMANLKELFVVLGAGIGVMTTLIGLISGKKKPSAGS